MVSPQRLDTRSAGRLNRTAGRGRYTRSLISSDDDVHTSKNGINSGTSHSRESLSTHIEPLSSDPYNRKIGSAEDLGEVSSYLEGLNEDASDLKGIFARLIKLREAAELIRGSAAVDSSEARNDRNAVLNATVLLYKRLEKTSERAASEVMALFHIRSFVCYAMRIIC